MPHDPADLSRFDLDADFAAHVPHIIAGCAEQGVDIRPVSGTRSPFVQARLWRQSRTTAVVRAEIARLTRLGCPFLAHCLESVGPQATKPQVTKAPPGLSWHQWGEALDFGWYVDDKYIGNAATYVQIKGRAVNGYRVLGLVAHTRGLTHGGTTWGWDWPHVQLRSAPSPDALYRLPEIDARMAERYKDSA